MSDHDDCPNTARFVDWMGHCKSQHEELNRLLREIHAALHGNGREGLVSRVARNSQRIEVVDNHVKDLRVDVDIKLRDLSKSLGALNVRFWKMAIVIAVILSVANATVTPIIRSVIQSVGS
jgi:uncharacterized protein YqiB (DUF1249 family)